VTPVELVKLHAAIAAVWPSRLVDELQPDQATFVCGALFADVPLEQALVVVEAFAKRSSPFPPSWPQIREEWQARAAGVSADADVIVNEWLAEVYAEVGHKGGTFYREMPEFSDPIIAEAVRLAAGGWQEWGLTPTGGEGEGGAFVRNLVPERDSRFRQMAKSMLIHRRQTGARLPEMLARREAARLERPVYELPPANDDESVPTGPEDEVVVAVELAARDRDRAERERRKAEAKVRLDEMREEG
jgi:hypothetical protein